MNAKVLRAIHFRSNPPVQSRVVEWSLLLVNTSITICTEERKQEEDKESEAHVRNQRKPKSPPPKAAARKMVDAVGLLEVN